MGLTLSYCSLQKQDSLEIKGNSNQNSCGVAQYCKIASQMLYCEIQDSMAEHVPGGGVLSYMGYIGMYGPKEYGFSPNLVINRASTLAIFVTNRVWFLHSSLEFSMFLRRSYFFIIINKTINRSPS